MTTGKAKPRNPAKQKESLVERVLKDRAKMQAQKSAPPPAPAAPYGFMHLLPEDMIRLP